MTTARRALGVGWLLFGGLAAFGAGGCGTDDPATGAAGGAGPSTGGTGGAGTGGAATGGMGTGGVPSGGVATGGLETGGTPTGGFATGGFATGGIATGGIATGGVATGGIATGGFATGGTPTGGSATGGSATGGSATGGSAPGGSATGGVPTGGVATGGVATGGTPTGGTGGSTVTFRNPLNTSHGSDPFMVYHEGYYYLVATTWGSSLTIKRGRTIPELKAASATTLWTDSNAARCCNMWAPELYLIDGPNGLRWYHYYTAGDGDDLGTQRSYVLESEGTDPMGPYHYQGQLLNYWAIDGSVLTVGSNRYFLFSTWEGSTQNVYVIAMANPWTVTGNRTRLTAPTYAWEQEGSDSVNEGPVALYHGGRTFVAYSASQCADPGYKLGLLELTGSNPLDAAAWWKSATPVFQTANQAYGAGHNGFFKSPDGTEDWIVYHATSNSNGSCWTDRTTRVQRFTWNTDGTPNFGVPLALSTDILVPSGE